MFVMKENSSTALFFESPDIFEPAHYLKLDETTVSNLELVRGLDGNRKWTLLATVDLTRTGMGARLLRSWVLRPSLDRLEIESRLDAAEELLGSAILMGKLGSLLDRVYDLERLLSRVTLEAAHPKDLLALGSSFGVLPTLAAELEPCKTGLLRPSFDQLQVVILT